MFTFLFLKKGTLQQQESRAVAARSQYNRDLTALEEKQSEVNEFRAAYNAKKQDMVKEIESLALLENTIPELEREIESINRDLPRKPSSQTSRRKAPQRHDPQSRIG